MNRFGNFFKPRLADFGNHVHFEDVCPFLEYFEFKLCNASAAIRY